MENGSLSEQYKSQFKDLIKSADLESDAELETLMSEIATLHDSVLHQELGQMARKVHDSFHQFASENRFRELAHDDIPDAKERLQYIVTKTDEAAHNTMTIAEEAISLAEAMEQRCQKLCNDWVREDKSFPEGRDASLTDACLIDVFRSMQMEAKGINEKMMQIIVAQEFQDITGQMIKKVINIVQELEQNMLRLVKLTATTQATEKPRAKVSAETAVGPQMANSKLEGVAHSQEDVDDVLASMGF